MSKLFYHFKLYNDVAETNKNNLLIYFLLKNYAFKMVFSAIGTNSNALNETERSKFDKLFADFQVEKSQNPNVPLISGDQYKQFLENYFNQFDFEKANYDTLNIGKDLTEILAIYGPLDDLALKRCNIIFLTFSGILP
jgi:hypothetical protein